MNLKSILSESIKIRNFIIGGFLLGVMFALVEYLFRLKTNDDPQLLIPLVIRAGLIGAFVMASILVFEVILKNWFRKRPFFYLVLVRSFFYTFIITLWLGVFNGVWFMLNDGMPFKEEIINYFVDDMYFINVSSIFLIAVLAIGIREINSLHGKGQLWNFIIGKYHKPREVELIFCFIDLKGSTTIAEKLGHLQFAKFLKDYFSDITEAIQNSKAQIYQYVGDEIILKWSYEIGLENNNMINCFFQMQEIINGLKQKYLKKYGVFPEFKAGIHGGQAIVTWVGEIKKEIVYVGDVLNTTARIQEDCKRLGKVFLISGELLDKVKDLKNTKAEFVDETVLRGKEERIKLFSLERAS